MYLFVSISLGIVFSLTVFLLSVYAVDLLLDLYHLWVRIITGIILGYLLILIIWAFIVKFDILVNNLVMQLTF